MTSAKTFQVNFFQNNAHKTVGSTIEPGLDADFTQALQNSILKLTPLALVTKKADLIYEGEIISYKITPTSATSAQNSALNRLTIEINVRFLNTVENDRDFEKNFSFFYDYDANALLESVKQQAHEIIFERINQDIFNASLGGW